MLPDPWTGSVLALAVFRLVRICGWDDFPPVARARRWATGEQSYRTGSGNAAMGVSSDAPQYVTVHRRPLLAHFIGCSYCLGAWISLAAFLAWRFAPTETLYGAAPFALSAAVGIISRMLDP